MDNKIAHLTHKNNTDFTCCGKQVKNVKSVTFLAKAECQHCRTLHSTIGFYDKESEEESIDDEEIIEEQEETVEEQEEIKEPEKKRVINENRYVNDGVREINELLIQAIKQVKQNKEYVPQATAISKLSNSSVGAMKLMMQLEKSTD